MWGFTPQNGRHGTVKSSIGRNEQNRYFAEMTQKVCLYIHTVVLQKGLASLDRKIWEHFELLSPEKWKRRSAKLKSVSQTSKPIDLTLTN